MEAFQINSLIIEKNATSNNTLKFIKLLELVKSDGFFLFGSVYCHSLGNDPIAELNLFSGGVKSQNIKIDYKSFVNSCECYYGNIILKSLSVEDFKLADGYYKTSISLPSFRLIGEFNNSINSLEIQLPEKNQPRVRIYSDGIIKFGKHINDGTVEKFFVFLKEYFGER